MRRKPRAKQVLRWFTILIGTTGLLAGMPSPMAGQTNLTQSAEQSTELKEAQQLSQQARELYQQGQYSAAIPLAERVLAISEKALGPEHPFVATSLYNLAELYHAQGNYVQAELLHQRALAIAEKALGLEHPDVATNLIGIAGLYYVQGNYAKAESLYQRALAIREKVQGPEHPNVATSLSNLALLYWAQGNYAKGEPLYQRALAIYEKALGPEHPNVAASLNNLARLLRDQGSYAKAEPLYQRALAITEKALEPQHPYVALSLNNLGQLFRDQGDTARALEFLTRGTNIEEQNLALILTTGSEADKRAYMATLSGTTNANINQHVQNAPDNPQAALLALTTFLRRKGRILDALTDSLQTLRQNLTPEDQKLLNQLAATRSQLAALLFKGTNLPPEQYRSQVASLRAQAEQLENTLAHRSAIFRAESQPVTLKAVQRLIPPNAALVELVLYRPFNAKATKLNERWGALRYAAYVLHSQGEPKWVDLGEAEPMNQAVASFSRVLQKPSKSSAEVKQVARTLDKKLMQPIRPLLGNSRSVLLSPDSQLNLIPFAALVDENNRYLVENYSISYLSSGRDLLRLQNSSQSRSKPVIVANPNYDQPGDPASVQAVANRSSNNRRSTELSQIEFGPLPGTAQEAQAVAPLLPGMKLLTGSQATENAIKRVNGPSILHIATHGFFLEDIELVAPPDSASTFPQDLRSIKAVPRPGARPSVSNPENPLLRSGVALAGFNSRQSGGEDGVLTALETAGLDLSGTKLVVLSACDTGVGDVANGEGVYRANA